MEVRITLWDKEKIRIELSNNVDESLVEITATNLDEPIFISIEEMKSALRKITCK